MWSLQEELLDDAWTLDGYQSPEEDEDEIPYIQHAISDQFAQEKFNVKDVDVLDKGVKRAYMRNLVGRLTTIILSPTQGKQSIIVDNVCSIKLNLQPVIRYTAFKLKRVCFRQYRRLIDAVDGWGVTPTKSLARRLRYLIVLLHSGDAAPRARRYLRRDYWREAKNDANFIVLRFWSLNIVS